MIPLIVDAAVKAGGAAVISEGTKMVSKAIAEALETLEWSDNDIGIFGTAFLGSICQDVSDVLDSVFDF